MENAHTYTTDEVLKHFKVDVNKGLTEKQIAESYQKYGPNGKFT